MESTLDQISYAHGWKLKKVFSIVKNDHDDVLHAYGKFQIIEVDDPDSQARGTYGFSFVQESKKDNPNPVFCAAFYACSKQEQIVSTVEDKTIDDVTCAECKEYLMANNLI